MICNRYLISGCVQGVFYRTNAQHQATALGVRGWVRNLLDGRVEILACADQDILKDFEKWLQIGPEYAKVSNIEIITESPKTLPLIFEVLPTPSL